MGNIIGGPWTPLGDWWCKTDLNTQKETKGTFTWTISGLLDRRDEYNEGQAVMSRVFTLRIPDGKETKWVLELVPKFNTHFVKVAIHSRNTFDVDTRIEMTIIDSNGTKCLVNNFFFNAPHFFTFPSGFELNIWKMDWSSLRQVSKEAFGYRYMPNGYGDLTFNFELIVYGKPKTLFGHKRLNNVQGPMNSENDLNLGEFYLSNELSDVLIKCKNKSFKAHKVLLSASSPVFRAMFQADMKENRSQQVEIEDIEPDIVAEMLKFIYKRSCVEHEENPDLDFVSYLLVASDKYQMRTLKNVCQTQLSSNLQVENSLKVTTFKGLTFLF